MLGVCVTERVDAPHRLLQHHRPVVGDVRGVVRVAERPRQARDQAAHRRGENDRIAVQYHQPCVRVHGRQRLECDRVVRALERPASPDAAALEDLQHRPVVLVRRTMIGAEEPAVVARDVRDRLPREADEVLAHDGDALGRSVGVFVVDRLHARVDHLEHVAALLGRIDARSRAVIGRRRRGDRVVRLPPQQRPVPEVLVEHVAEKGGAGAEHPDDDDRGVDRLVGDLRVPSQPIDDPQPVHERGDDRSGDRDRADLTEPCVGVHRLAVGRESLGVGVGAEVVESGLGVRLIEECVDLQS